MDMIDLNDSSTYAWLESLLVPPSEPTAEYNFLVDPTPSNTREMRNRAEKLRRDKLNSYIMELSKMVPMIANSAKRMDKTSVLRLTATHLRIYHTLINVKRKPLIELPNNLNSSVLEKLVCEQLGGFLLIVTTSGKVVFVSQTVETLLGHIQTDLMGLSIYSITYPDDQDRLRNCLSPDSLPEQQTRQYFSIKMRRSGSRAESNNYEPVRVVALHRFSNEETPCELRQGPSTSTSTSCTQFHSHNGSTVNLEALRNSKAVSDALREAVSLTLYGDTPAMAAATPSTSNEISRNKATTSHTSSHSLQNDLVLLFVRVHRPYTISTMLLEATQDEYVTRHLIDGRIINCDHRISLIAGYLTDEVSGMSAFKFMHRDDVRWVMIALRQMYDRGESNGSSCYRLLSRNGQFIYLRTLGYLEIDDQGTVESFVCINTLVSEEEGIHLINDMKRRFAALINTNNAPIALGSGSSSDSNIPSVEDPEQVDEAVVHLITNLPSPVQAVPPMPVPDPMPSVCANDLSAFDPAITETLEYCNAQTPTNTHPETDEDNKATDNMCLLQDCDPLLSATVQPNDDNSETLNAIHGHRHQSVNECSVIQHSDLGVQLAGGSGSNVAMSSIPTGANFLPNICDNGQQLEMQANDLSQQILLLSSMKPEDVMPNHIMGGSDSATNRTDSFLTQTFSLANSHVHKRSRMSSSHSVAPYRKRNTSLASDQNVYGHQHGIRNNV